jgi:DNA-binding MarR family transcriptional regulator
VNDDVDRDGARLDDGRHDDGLARSIFLVAHLLEQQLDRALRPLRISMRQYLTLRTISENPFVSRTELARLLQISPQAVGGLTGRLAEAGLLGWAPILPGAPKHYQLTPTGSDRVERGHRIVHSLERVTVATLSPNLADSVDGAMHELLMALVRRVEHTYR